LNKYEEIEDLKKHLLYKNRETYTNILFYISTHNLKDDELYGIEMDIIVMALNAQQRGDSLSDIIGENPKEFCNQIIAESKKKSTFTKFKDIVVNLFLAIDIYIVIVFLVNALIDINQLTVFTLGHLIFVIITFFEFEFLFHYLKKEAIITKHRFNYTTVGFLGLIIIIISAVLLVNFYNIKLFEINLWLLGIVAFMTIVPKLLFNIGKNIKTQNL
jgi:DNA-binding ferritin-like protein (Dps family)